MAKIGKVKLEKKPNRQKREKIELEMEPLKSLDQIMHRPGVDLIINASLALNASRTRRKRVFFLAASRTKHKEKNNDLNMSQKLLRLLFIATIVSILVLSAVSVVCISQALIYSNYECILAAEIKIRRDSVGIEIDRLHKHLSPCLYCFR